MNKLLRLLLITVLFLMVGCKPYSVELTDKQDYFIKTFFDQSKMSRYNYRFEDINYHGITNTIRDGISLDGPGSNWFTYIDFYGQSDAVCSVMLVWFRNLSHSDYDWDNFYQNWVDKLNKYYGLEEHGDLPNGVKIDIFKNGIQVEYYPNEQLRILVD